ncbi:MAG: C40 family peptidase [Clostridia bacterium]|nr:C40 family peptidase [Clostridia bacterium]
MSIYDDDDIEEIDEVDESVSDEIKQRAKDKALDKFEKKLSEKSSQKFQNSNSTSKVSNETAKQLSKETGKQISQEAGKIASSEGTKAISSTATNAATSAATSAGTTAATSAGTTAAAAAGTTAATAAGTAAATTAATTTATAAATTAATTAGATAATTAAGTAAGSVVPVVGNIIGALVGLIAGFLIDKIQKKKKEKEEQEGDSSKIKKLMKNPLVLMLLIVFILVVVVVGVEKDEVIDSLSDLIQRREKRYAKFSDVVYERTVTDDDGNPIVDENGQIKKEEVKPILLFTDEEINELMVTSYFSMENNQKLGYEFSDTQSASMALANFHASIFGEMEDPCYNQILYSEEENEIADFLSSAGLDTDSIKDEAIDAEDQLQVSSFFVKYCINAPKENFNDINWMSGDDSGNYSVVKSEKFTSEDEYKNNSVEIEYYGDGSVSLTTIPDSDKKEYLDSGLKIPNVLKYPVAVENLGGYKVLDNYNNNAEAKTLMQYVSMTEDHLIKWIVPFSLLTETNGDFVWVEKITEDAQSELDVTLYNLQQLTKTIEREYYLDTEIYYEYDVVTYRVDKTTNIFQQIVDTLVYQDKTHHDTKTNLYNGVYKLDNSDTSNEEIKADQSKGASPADIGLASETSYEVNGVNYRKKIENVRRVCYLKKDAAGNYIIAKDENGKEKVKEINVSRQLQPYKIVPKLTYAEDMYNINRFNYSISPIVEDDDLGDTIGNEDTPVELIDGQYGRKTTVKKYYESLSSSYTETKKYSLSYMSDEKEKNKNISRIEWVQDFGRLVEGDSTSSLTGSDNLEKIWNYLKGKGCSDIATAAIIGNIGVESANTFSGTIVQNHISDVDTFYQSYNYNIRDGLGVGICQWTYYTRKQYLLDLAIQANTDWYDLGIQLDCLWNEINGLNGASRQMGNSSMEVLNSMTDIAAATELFCDSFERPGVPHLDSRINYATSAYNLYAGKTINTDQESTTTYTVGEQVASEAIKYVGLAYVFGAADLNAAVDCSGFTMCIYKKFGYNIPHSAAAQYNEGTRLYNFSTETLAPGDLLFKENTYKAGISHVGIYLGGGKIVEALNPDKGVIISDFNSSWTKAVRLVEDSETVIGSQVVPEGAGTAATTEATVIFGEGNVFSMYPTKTASEKINTYNKYYGERETSSGSVYPKGYSKDDLIVAYEYIEHAYRSVIGSDALLSDAGAFGGESANVSAHCNTQYTMGGRVYYNLQQGTYDSSYVYGGGLVSQQGCTIISISIIGKAFGTDGYLEQCCTNGGKYTKSFAYVVSDLNTVTGKSWASKPGPRQGTAPSTAASDIDKSIANGYPVLIECLGAKRGGTPTNRGGFTNGNQHWMVLCDVKVENGEKYYYIQTLFDSSTGWFTDDMLFANLNRYYVVNE